MAQVANAQKSTGPVTELGKAAAARNAILHGLTSNCETLDGEPENLRRVSGAGTKVSVRVPEGDMTRAEEALARVGCEDINPRLLVRDLPLSRRQMVEIAKALVKTPRLLILDEATSALTSEDVERVFGTLRGLRDKGLSILTISHRMQEIEALADHCSVFRNGMHIDTFRQGDRTSAEIVTMMIGRDISAHFPPKPPARTRPERVAASPSPLRADQPTLAHPLRLVL